METNPFAAPAPDGDEPFAAERSMAFAEGELLHVERHGVLPKVCTKCGSVDDVKHVRHRSSLAVVLPATVAARLDGLGIPRPYDIRIGLCPIHRILHLLGRGAGLTSLLVGMTALFASPFLTDAMARPAQGVALVAIVLALLLVLALGMPLWPRGSTDSHVIFKGAHRELLAAVTRASRRRA